MARLHLLGTGAAISDPHRTTTMLAVENDESVVVVDCGGDVVQRLMASDVELDHIVALIITHEHPDHVSGFPLFVEKMWLAGRRDPIDVYGITPALEQAQRTLGSFDMSGFEDLPEIRWHKIDLEEHATVLDNGHWQIVASPGNHFVPVVGLRILDKENGGVLVYSGDTEKTESITRLAKQADVLIHEATGSGTGHATAKDAAEVAAAAGAKEVLLVHLPPEALLDDDAIEEARAVFPNLAKGEEGGLYLF